MTEGAPQEAFSPDALFDAAQRARYAMLTAGVEATERYLATIPGQRVGQPEDDPVFKAAEQEYDVALSGLSHYFDEQY